MILHGKTDGKKIVASLSRHHYVSHGNLMMDGGQCLTNHYAGYSIYSMDGDSVWFEIPETFEELYESYNNKKHDGIWDFDKVRIIPNEEYEKIDTFQEKVNNFIWGTNGKNGDEPFKRVLLKNCTKEHLENILKNVPNIHEETEKVIKYLINEK